MYWSWMGEPHPTHKLPVPLLIAPLVLVDTAEARIAPGKEDGTIGPVPTDTAAATVTDE